MKKSIGLLSALVVSTTFIVNCQKAPDKRRVRPSGGSGTGVQTDVTQEKAKLPAKVCSAEVLNLYKAFYKNKAALKNSPLSATSTDADKEAYKKLGVETLAKCDEIINALKTEQNQGCYMDNGVKDMSNALMSENMQGLCNAIGKKLKTEVDLDSSYADAAKAADKAKENEKQIEALKNKPLKITSEGLALFLQGNTNLGQYIVDGEIKTSSAELEQALTASKTVCTGFSKSLTGGFSDASEWKNEVYISQFAAADSDIIKVLDINFKGKATLLPVVIKHKDGQGATTTPLVCLNMDSEKLSAEVLAKAFGKVITLPATQITTEVTGGTSEAAVVSTPAASTASSTASATTHASDKLAAAQPEGSPQQKLLDEAVAPTVKKEAEQKAADQKAAQEKAAADKKAADEKAVQEKKAKEEQKPAVTLVPATGVSSPAVAAKVEAEGKATKEELASMKEKAERLEKEAKDAEAEVTKLETEKAKADDIDQAKAKARIARESANSAKAEYDAAAKQA